MKTKLLSFIFLPLLAVIFSVFTPLAQADNTGSISVCKIIVDQNNNIVTGSDKAGQSFSISGFTPNPTTSQGDPAGVLPTTTFTTPLTYNAHILSGTSGNDSDCTTYSNLALGNYYWAQEVNNNSGWDTTYYSDQYTGPANSVIDLYTYDNNLFDGNPLNDNSRNLNADGHIVLTQDRPNRELIVLNRYATQPFTTNGGSSNSGGSGGSNNGGSSNNSSSNNSVSAPTPTSGPAFTIHTDTGVLGDTTTPTPVQDVQGTSSVTDAICAQCLWWPMLLGEIIFLTALYIAVRKKKLGLRRLIAGGFIAVLAYIIFLLMNRNHVCPDGNITLWIFSLPCKYFWVFDGAIFVLLSWLLKEKTSKTSK